MYIDYARAYERLKREREQNKELTFKEWINTVKQLGMMHIIYWRLREFELYLGELNAKRLHPFPAKTLYETSKREKALIVALDNWEQEYKHEMKRKAITKNIKKCLET